MNIRMKRTCGYAGVFLILVTFFLWSCKKTGSDVSENPDETGDTPSDSDQYAHPEDPGIASTVGFFMDDWQAKDFVPPEKTTAKPTFSGDAEVNISVDMNHILTKVSKDIYGNNSNTWMGQIVNQPKLMGYLKDLSPNIIRGPGGSISDIYFWNVSSEQNVPDDVPEKRLNKDGDEIDGGYWFGKNTASWTLSIDHYYQLLQETNSQGVLTVNYGYARYGTSDHPVQKAAHLAANWVRYDNGRTKYWEIGNESYGNWEAGYRIDLSKNKDGQPEIITGKLYAQQAAVFIDSMRAAASEIGSKIYIGAVLVEAQPASWETSTVKTWNKGVLGTIGDAVDFFSVHSYFTDYQTDAGVKEILATATTIPSKIMNYVKNQLSTYGLSLKPIALTEWNIQSTGSKQQVSYIAGMHAAITLGALIENKFGEASRWDLANGWDQGNDHGMFNVGDAPGGVPKWNPRPAFYYMYYFQKVFGDRMVDSKVQGSDQVLCYASSLSQKDGGIILINKGEKQEKISIDIKHFTPNRYYYWYCLTGGTDNGDFSRKVFVNENGPKGISGGPNNYADLSAFRAKYDSGIRVVAPPHSVLYIQTSGK